MKYTISVVLLLALLPASTSIEAPPIPEDANSTANDSGTLDSPPVDSPNSTNTSHSKNQHKPGIIGSIIDFIRSLV